MAYRDRRGEGIVFKQFIFHLNSQCCSKLRLQTVREREREDEIMSLELHKLQLSCNKLASDLSGIAGRAKSEQSITIAIAGGHINQSCNAKSAHNKLQITWNNCNQHTHTGRGIDRERERESVPARAEQTNRTQNNHSNGARIAHTLRGTRRQRRH